MTADSSASNLALTLHLPDAAATHRLGIALGQQSPAGTVLLLHGDLGSGKTSLVQGIAQGLGITEPVSSPTFVLINEYLDGRLPLYHIDLYRLESAEVEVLQLDSYWEGSDYPAGIVAIEWASRLSRLPSTYLAIHLASVSPEGREAVLVPHGLSWSIDCLDQL